MYLTEVGHLLEGRVPEMCRLTYLAAVTRAKRLLVDVEIATINENLSNIAWMIDDIPEYPSDESPEDTPDDSEEIIKQVTFADLQPSPTQILEKDRHDIVLDADNALTWPQYFGVLALYCATRPT